MGAVWAGVHVASGTPVALKFVRASPAAAELRHRLWREARIGAGIRHPNVVSVHGVFELSPDQPVVVMELLHGETLRNKLQCAGRLSVASTLALLLPVMSALAAAHSLGVVHRDLKPENIFLARDGEKLVPKVLDFGFAKLTAREGAMAASVPLTRDGAVLGTWGYMSLEQLTGEPVDQRTDVWALGVILYECLSGGRPLEANEIGPMLRLLLTAAITPLEVVAPEVPRDMARVVMQLLARRAEDRLPDLNAAYAALALHAFAPGGPAVAAQR